MILTELEGAVLSEIHHRGHRTAFKVRRAFQLSPSTEWSGSAGAVYPAIRRLVARDLIYSELLPTKRQASRLSVTPNGVLALERWATDPSLALGVGIDPFRLRAGIWASLTPQAHQECLTRMLSSVDAQIASLTENLSGLDSIEEPRARWALLLQRTRRLWIEEELVRRGSETWAGQPSDRQSRRRRSSQA